MKKRHTVGVVTAECYREYTSEMIRGIIAQSELADCNVMVLATKNNFQEPVSPHVEHEAEIFRLIELSDFDGFLYDQNAFNNRGVQKKLDALLKRMGKPVMLLDAGEHPFFENTVSHDPEAFALIIEHMIQVHGCRRIYCLTGTRGTTQAEERLETYFHVMQRHGLPYDESCYAYGDFWRNAPVQFAQRMISGELSMPEAVVCANDIMADTLIAALEKAGIRVLGDIAVTGFDGYLDYAQSDVSITSFPKTCYQPEYCTLISYLCLALEQLEERSLLRAQSGSSTRNMENPQLYRQLAQLREEMQLCPENDWSVQELCGRTHVSRSYLQRMYKKYFGKSIVEELIFFRLRKAKELISGTDLTMSQIAELCGYASYAHFAKQFKVNEGMSLSEYRKRFRKSTGRSGV